MTQAELVKAEVDGGKSMYIALADLEIDDRIAVVGSFMTKHFFDDGSVIWLDFDQKWIAFKTVEGYEDFINDERANM